MKQNEKINPSPSSWEKLEERYLASEILSLDSYNHSIPILASVDREKGKVFLSKESDKYRQRVKDVLKGVQEMNKGIRSLDYMREKGLVFLHGLPTANDKKYSYNDVLSPEVTDGELIDRIIGASPTLSSSIASISNSELNHNECINPYEYGVLLAQGNVIDQSTTEYNTDLLSKSLSLYSRSPDTGIFSTEVFADDIKKKLKDKPLQTEATIDRPQIGGLFIQEKNFRYNIKKILILSNKYKLPIYIYTDGEFHELKKEGSSLINKDNIYKQRPIYSKKKKKEYFSRFSKNILEYQEKKLERIKTKDEDYPYIYKQQENKISHLKKEISTRNTEIERSTEYEYFCKKDYLLSPENSIYWEYSSLILYQLQKGENTDTIIKIIVEDYNVQESELTELKNKNPEELKIFIHEKLSILPQKIKDLYIRK